MTGRRAIATAGAAVLLVGPTVIAFASGGYFDESRLIAGIVAWILVAVAAFVSPHPLPRSWPGRLALAGLAVLTAWTAISMAWAPLGGPAQDDVGRLLLYLGTLVAAAALLRGEPAMRAVEPVLALGATLVLVYAISERLLPGVIDLASSRTARGRLEQPLTYWNAMGALAAMGTVLCTRLAGDRLRPTWMSAAAAAATVPLVLGLYLTFSRGGLAALAAGLVVLAALSPTREQLRAVVVVVVAGVIASIVGGALPAVRALEGGLGSREREGLVMLAVLLALAISAALAMVFLRRREADGRTTSGAVAVPRRRLVLGVVLGVLVAGSVLLAGATERRDAATNGPPGATASRLRSIESNRYEYWGVALEAFADHPLAGVGSGGFRVEWRRHRTIDDPAVDAHSLYIETAAELGMVGLLALALALAGVVAASAAALRRRPAAAAGWVATMVVFALHAGLDWDWEMPAVSLVALLLAGAAIAAADEPITAVGEE